MFIAAGVLVALCAIGLAIGLALAPGRSGSNSASTISPTTQAPLSVAGSLDTFSGPDNLFSLDSPGEPSWMAVTGLWGITAGQAYVSAPTPGRDLTLIDLGRPNGAIQVTMPRMTQGAGLVFRYRDRANYWYVTAVPGYATWAVVKVTAGREQGVANTGLSPVQDGTTVAVAMRGDTIDVALNGTVRRSLTNPILAQAHLVGLTASGTSAAGARFDDFRAALPGGLVPPLTVP